LKQIVAGGAKFQSSSAQKAIEVLRCEVQQVLGMAEGFCTGTRLGDSLGAVLDTVGRPYSEHDEYRLVGLDGSDVGPDEIGELLVSGPYTIRGYYKALEHNTKSFTPDGFYRTGDLLRRDQNGDLVVEGRNKDVINRAGEKISAEEVEDLIADHPGISGAVLVAMPDPVTGEKGCLFAIPKDGAALTLEDITAHLTAKRVARFKFPERLEIIEAFPMTAVGKVSRRDLRDLVARKVAEDR
jgi:2,3-dihydroxybenzoate-AMP ligase